MTELFLIAHCVRGEAAFDVAEQMECPHCMPIEPSADFLRIPEEGCFECEGNGYWWIIPTSGHRAFPYWSLHFENILGDDAIPDMPPSWPDHYKVNAAPKVDIKALFKSTQPQVARIARRL